jgi:hypothetical protein
MVMKSEYRKVGQNYILQLGAECLMIGEKVGLLVDLDAGGLIVPATGLVFHGQPELVQHHYRKLLEDDLRDGRARRGLTYVVDAFPLDELNDVMQCISHAGMDHAVYASSPLEEFDAPRHYQQAGLRSAG